MAKNGPQRAVTSLVVFQKTSKWTVMAVVCAKANPDVRSGDHRRHETQISTCSTYVHIITCMYMYAPWVVV